MKLYHFTASHMLDGCRKDGLTLGAVPILGPLGQPLRMARSIQWLTRNPDWDQSWATSNIIKYPRNVWRIEIRIPKTKRLNLVPWVQVAMLFGSDTQFHLGAGYDQENWFLYRGRVPASWFREIAANPAYAQASIQGPLKPSNRYRGC